MIGRRLGESPGAAGLRPNSPRRSLLARLPLVALVIAIVTAVAAAVSGAAKPVPGLQFVQAGHWVAHPALGMAFHVNGSTKGVDARVPVPGIEPGSQVVQGETSGYVVGRKKITEFGKSTLSVEREIVPPTGERPVAVETPGGPYLVYRETGRVVRLGEQALPLRPLGRLGKPVATPDGTLWLHLLDSGVLCELGRDDDEVSCPVSTPQGHTGALSVVGEEPVFVDTSDDTVSRIEEDSLGKAVELGLDVPPTAEVASADAAGRIPILDQGSGGQGNGGQGNGDQGGQDDRMYLVDTVGLSGGQSAQPVTVDLPEGRYTGPVTAGPHVVLLDQDRKAVLTYTSEGEQKQTAPLPPESGEPQLFRGEDERVYVDGAEGEHVLVVDENGAVTPVPVAPAGNGEGPRKPLPPPAEPEPESPPQPDPPSLPDPERVDPDPPVLADDEPERPAPPTKPEPDPKPASKPDPKPKPDPDPEPQPEPEPEPVPASPPGVPANVFGDVQEDSVTINWDTAPDNGSAITAYHVSWTSDSGAEGAVERPGSARSANLTGLEPGVAYTVTVVAENEAGRGSAAQTEVELPQEDTRKVTVTRGTTETFDEDCEAPDCAKMLVEMTGFEPNTDYHVEPHSEDPDYTNPGGTYTTDENGNYSFEAFHFGQVGLDVWVTVDGIESNHYTWEAE